MAIHHISYSYPLDHSSLIIINHLPFTIYHLPLTIHHSPFIINDSPFIFNDSPLMIHHSPFIFNYSPFMIHHSPFTNNNINITSSPGLTSNKGLYSEIIQRLEIKTFHNQ
ncbi:hypothetical protein ACTA71_004161 [Dictyostelium dimigraforme]